MKDRVKADHVQTKDGQSFILKWGFLFNLGKIFQNLIIDLLLEVLYNEVDVIRMSCVQ